MKRVSRNLRLATFAALAVVAVAAEARTWYVKLDGSGNAPTILAAMDSATAGDAILLAPGTYTWTSQEASGPCMIRLKREVALRGESGAASTVLDAEQRGRVLLLEGPGSVELEGLTITNGRAMGFPGSGGGILTGADSELHISSCIIRGNTANTFTQIGTGGGISCSQAVVTNSQIENNTSAEGGGIYGVNVTLSGCSIRGNYAAGHSTAAGGGVYVESGTITDCWFEDNSAPQYGYAEGGGVRIRDGSIVRCTFIGNSASASGGGAAGGAVLCEDDCTVDACIFVGNEIRSDYGPGGTLAGYGAVAVTSCTLVGNRASVDYAVGRPAIGGIAIARGSVTRSIIAWNDGAGLWSQGDCAGGPTVSFCDLFDNSAGDGFCAVDGGENFSADPEFCAADPAASLHFALQMDSPCATRVAPGVIGAAPVGCGSVSVQQRSWSAVKELFRNGRP